MPRPRHAIEADPTHPTNTQKPPTKKSPKPRKAQTYSDQSSTYWTPGWSYARYSKASKEELLALPDGELEKMQAGFREVLGEDGVAALAEHMFEEEQREAKNREGKGGNTKESGDSVEGKDASRRMVDWLQLWQKRHKGQQWGFVAMKTSCYDDADRWETFKAQFGKIIDVAFEREEGSDAEEAKGKFEIRWIEDPELEDAKAEVLQEKYKEIRKGLPAGLSHPVFLCASPSTIESVLSPSSPVTVDSRRWRPSVPYIIAISALSDPGLEEGHEEREWFREVFKVAVEVLVDEFWMVLDLDMTPLRRITRGVKGASLSGDVEGDEGLEEIWWSTAPSPDRMRKRRRLG